MCEKSRDLRSIARKVGIIFGAVQSILADILGMSMGLARWILQMLTDDQKRTRLNISRYLLCCYEVDPWIFIERVVTHDETLVHHFAQSQNAEQTMQAPWLKRGFIQQ